MSKPKTLEQYIEGFEKVHGKGTYDYSKIKPEDIVNSKSKLLVECHEINVLTGKEHGPFEVSVNNHYSQKSGCPDCKLITIASKLRKSIPKLKDCFNKKHNNKYDYDLVTEENYKNNRSIIPVKCNIINEKTGKEHGVFKISVGNHLNGGNGCPECKKIKLSEFFREPFEQVIKDLEKVHGKDRYDYSLIKKEDYENQRSLLRIICHRKDKYGEEHGEFTQSNGNHKSGHGCQKCWRENGRRTPIKEVIERLENLYGDKFDFSLISEENYQNWESKLPIMCHIIDEETGKEHGIFYRTMGTLTRITNCPNCNVISKMEQKTEKWLINNHFEYITQKRFPNCKYINTLSIDFYLPKENISIECDGEQHDRPVQFGGMSLESAVKNFEDTKNRDKAKDKYCADNNIRLIRISYKDKLIEKLNECLIGG